MIYIYIYRHIIINIYILNLNYDILCFLFIFPGIINLSTFGGHGHTLVLQEFVLHIDHLVPELLQL